MTSPLSEPARLAAHVLLDILSARTPDAPEDENSAAMHVAYQRLDEVGAVTATIDDTTGHLDVNMSALFAGVLASTQWLLTRLSAAHDTPQEQVLFDLRAFLDGQPHEQYDWGVIPDFTPQIAAALTAVRAALEPGGESPATLSDFRRAVAAGEPCARLIEIKNAIRPKSLDLDTANRELRAVGCYSSESARTDL